MIARSIALSCVLTAVSCSEPRPRTQDRPEQPSPGAPPAAALAGVPTDPDQLLREGFSFPEPPTLPPDDEQGRPPPVDPSLRPYTFTIEDHGGEEGVDICPPSRDHRFQLDGRSYVYRLMDPPGTYEGMVLPAWPQFVPQHSGQLPPTKRIVRYAATVNARGLRGERIYATQAPAETYRVGVIGTGVTFGEGVEDDQVYAVQLEELLNRAPPAELRFEVINFGVSSTTTDMAAGLLLRHDADYAPDAWIIAFGVNDALPMFGRPIETFRADLDHLVATVERLGKTTLFLVEPANTFYPWMAEYEAYMQVFRRELGGRMPVLDAAGLLDCHELADGLRLEQVDALQRLVRYRGGQPQILLEVPFTPAAGRPSVSQEVYDYLDDHQVFLRTFITDVHMNAYGHRVLAEALGEWLTASVRGAPPPNLGARACGWLPVEPSD
jgi:lysophospholipase L1-like esterase